MSAEHRRTPEHLKDLDNLYSLRTIAEKLGVEPNTLSRWAEPSRHLDFPTPKEKLGRYNLYDFDEVERWVFLWQKINGNLGRGDDLNGKRTDG